MNRNPELLLAIWIENEPGFQADTANLYKDPFAYPPDSWESGDTLFHSSVVYSNNCFSIPMDQICYIGLKKTNGTRLGWIRLGVFGYYKVLVLESAIQHIY